MAKRGLTPREKAEREAREELKAINATIRTLEGCVKSLKIQAKKLERTVAENAYQNAHGAPSRASVGAGQGREE